MTMNGRPVYGKDNARVFSQSTTDTSFRSTASKSFMFRNKVYASPSAALDAYIAAELPKTRTVKAQDDVQDLLLSGIFSFYGSHHFTRNPSILEEAESQRNASLHQLIERAYEKLEQAKTKSHSAENVINASEAVLNQVALDNLSSVPGSSRQSQLSSVSTQSLLNAAPGGSSYNPLGVNTDHMHPTTSTPYVPGTRRKQTLSELDLSLERLKNSLREEEREALLAAHLSSRSVGKLSKLREARKEGHLRSMIKESMSSPDLFSKKNENSSSRTGAQSAKDDMHLSQVRRAHKNGPDQYGKHSSKMSYFKGQKAARKAPSWVEDLANTEITSVAGTLLDQTQDENRRIGRALSLEDLSASMTKAPSRVWRGDKNGYRGEQFDFLPPAHRERIRHHMTEINSTMAKDTSFLDADRLSLTTDDLCFAAPDASNLKSILRTPNSPLKKAHSHLSSSTDDLLVESPKGKTYPVNKGVTGSPQAVRFNINGDVFDSNNRPRVSASAGPNPEHSNNRHREYIRQLIKEIEDSSSVITSHIDTSSKDAATPPYQPERPTTVDLDGSFVPRMPEEKLASQLDNSGSDIDETIQRLLSTPAPEDQAPVYRDRVVASPNTEEILDGDRSWERYIPAFKTSQKTEDNIVDKFLQECKSLDQGQTRLTGNPHPGGMEALKNILFTVQTMVPPSEVSDQFEDEQDPSVSNSKMAKGKHNQVPQSLQHLLVSDSESDTAAENQKPTSLNVAMQHLSQLRALMETKRPAHMTSTPNR